MPDEPKAILGRYLDALFSVDAAELARLLSESVVYHVPPFAGMPDVVGRSEVIAFLRENSSRIYQPGSVRYEPQLLLADDSGGLALVEVTGTMATGKPYENRYAIGVRLAAGSITEIWGLLDTAVFLRSFESG